MRPREARRSSPGAAMPRTSACALLALVLGVAAAAEGYRDTPLIPGQTWHVHDADRPQPRVIAPGTASTAEQPGKPPSDAVVLFDGGDCSRWRTAWKIE